MRPYVQAAILFFVAGVGMLVGATVMLSSGWGTTLNVVAGYLGGALGIAIGVGSGIWILRHRGEEGP